MSPLFESNLLQTRRQFFGHTGLRLGGLGLTYAMGTDAFAAPKSQVHEPLPGLPHFAAKAKAVIYLHMNGGPSQLDTWDYKPGLQQWYDKDLPPSVQGGQRLTGMTSKQARFPVAPSLFKFAQHGQCGRWVSELLPHTAKHVDDIALIKTVHTNAINHDPACTFVMTGREVPGFASLGSWLAYGLGSESNDLPAFVVLTPTWSAKAMAQALFTRMWSSGFLPSKFSGVALRAVGDPVLYIQNPDGVSPAHRRAMRLLGADQTSDQRDFYFLVGHCLPQYLGYGLAPLGGDFSRRGYAKRIAVASGAALMLRLAAFAATSAAGDDPQMNIVQYALPAFVVALISFFYFVVPALRRRRLRAAPSPRLKAA